MSHCSLKIGIVGLPNVGKSTLFNALTTRQVPAENFPFCTVDSSVGIVSLPDERLDKLAEISNSAQKIPAGVEFVDIAGLVQGAAEGKGLGNQFLSNIREMDAIVQVVRVFDDLDIYHYSGEVNPRKDIEVINLELLMADLQTIANRKQKIEKDVRAEKGDVISQKRTLEKLERAINAGRMIKDVKLTEEEEKQVYDLHLLTKKPILYVLNKKAEGANLDEQRDKRYSELTEYLNSINAECVFIDSLVEYDLVSLSNIDKEEFRREYGYFEDGLNSLIKKAFNMLELINYFTTGPDETRSWTIKKDSTAPEAGSAIHTDFKDKFIKADVIDYKELMRAGSISKACEMGIMRLEGKTYIVKDGDVIIFKI